MPRSGMKRLAGTLAIASVVALGSCSGDSTSPSGTVKDYFSAVQAAVMTPSVASLNVGGISGPRAKRQPPSMIAASVSAASAPTVSFHDGAPPGGGGPTVMGQAESSPFVGQPFRYGISGSANFTTVYISVAGVTGYWQVDLGTSSLGAELVLTLANRPPSSTFTLQTAIGSAGSAGTPLTATIAAADLSTTDVAVVLTWTGPSDVDLHVVDPKGQEVYWNAPTTPEGGKLNLDSNPACALDNANQEIISWPTGTAPTGTYNVLIDYYDSCNQTSAPWTIKVLRKGQQLIAKNGTLTGTSTAQPVSVTSFTFP